MASSPHAVAIVFIPTGPPLNFVTIASIILLSISSNPFLSIFRELRLFIVISLVIFPSPSTSAKSLTLLNKLFNILGVPLLLEAISKEAFSSIGILSISADRLTILVSIFLS